MRFRLLRVPLFLLASVFAGGGVFFSAPVAASDGLSPVAEPLNLSDAKAAVEAYVEDGRYARDFAAVAAEVRAWIAERVAARRPGERLAVVLDIDETVLSNLTAMRAEDFGYHPAEWLAWTEKAEAPALVPMRELFLAARAADVAVLFLTGREERRDRTATEKNLRREGMGDYTVLKFAPTEGPKRTSRERKTAARIAWAAEGWTLIASIGDQESDLGEPAERGFKLPNPFYRIE